MLTMIIMTVIGIVAILLILKSGWLFHFISNVPFFDKVLNVVSGYFNQTTGNTTINNSAGDVLTNVLEGLVFCIIFTLLVKFISSCLKEGRRENISTFKRIIRAPFEKFAAIFFTAVFTSVLVELLIRYVFQLFQSHRVFLNILITIIIIAVLVLGYFVVGLSAVAYALWVLGVAIFPSIVNLIAVEFIIVFAYYLLNIPGMLEQVGSMSIMIIGIICCIGAMFGADFFSDRCRDGLEESRNKGRHSY